MNERSFIVKPELPSAAICFPEMRRTHDPYEHWLRDWNESPKPPAKGFSRRHSGDALVIIKLQHTQRLSGLGIR
jgi:hypothetical protein